MADAEKEDAAESARSKPKAGRSPSYPSIGLETALDHARALYEKNAKTNHPVAFELAVEHCGFTKKSSAGRLQLAALRKYGLIDYIGSGAKRAIKLTDRALDILTDERENSTERAKRIAEAALEPDIFRDIYKRWEGKLPDEATVKFYLRREKGYTDSAVPDLITNYQRTIEFAKQQASGTMPVEDLDKGREEVPPIQSQGGSHVQTQRPNVQQNTPPAPGMRDVPLPLLSGPWATLTIPEKMDEADWKQMLTVLNAMKPAIVKAKQAAASPLEDEDDPIDEDDPSE